MNIKWIGAHANNFGKGRDGKQVKLVVLHWIVGTLKSADATFAKPDRKATAHYGVGGREVHQYVQESDTAWHAGNLAVNKESIGIEHEGGPDLPITEETVKTSIELVTDICRRYNLPADSDHIKRHSDIKATQCPGTLPVEHIIGEVKKNLLPPAAGQPIDDAGRAILALERFRVEFQHGNLEGAMNALLGAYRDLQTVKPEIEGLKNELRDRDSFIQGQKITIEELKSHQGKLAELLGVENDFAVVYGEVKKLVEVETNLSVALKKIETLEAKLNQQPSKTFWEWLFGR